MQITKYSLESLATLLVSPRNLVTTMKTTVNIPDNGFEFQVVLPQ